MEIEEPNIGEQCLYLLLDFQVGHMLIARHLLDLVDQILDERTLSKQEQRQYRNQNCLDSSDATQKQWQGVELDLLQDKE